jgi:starch phosphorylase
LSWLYLKGVSSGEMESALCALLGPEAKGLSASTVARLKQQWGEEYQAWHIFKEDNKRLLAEYVLRHHNVSISPHSLFDVMVKRIHEYKRQLLLGLFVVARYLRMKDAPHRTWTPRTVIVAGKAAPGYVTAKLIIKFINSVAEVVNRDPAVNQYLRLVFIPNFSVSVGERVYPAADLSEQISLAGKEASGTGI